MAQIQVNDNSFTPLAITIIRNLIIAVAGTNAYVTDDLASKLASALVTLVAIGYGAYKAYHVNEQKKAMEPFVPDAVAAKK